MKRILLMALVLMATPKGPLSAETLVAATTIRGATLIGPDDVRVVPEPTPGALTAAEDAVGMEARVNLYPGRAIHAADLRPPAIIGRNDVVTLRYAAAGIVIVTEGRAMERAAEGERIRVINLSSRTTVTAVAAGPGLAVVGETP